jgi:esterase/lipase superfamily enzyme
VSLTNFVRSIAASAFVCFWFSAVYAQQQVTVDGTVTFADGSVASGVNVELLRDGTVVAQTTTDTNGEFSIRVPVAAGVHHVRVTFPGFGVTEQSVNVVGASQRVRLQLPGPSTPPPPPPPPRPTEPPTVAPDQDAKILQVFYATDRARANVAGEFENARSTDGSLTLGRIDVNIPPAHRVGELERPSWWTIHRSSKDEFFQIVNRTTDTHEGFYIHLATRVNSSPDRDAFVFIHGYNVSFDDAVFRTAQIAHDLTFKGAPILFSWPSRASLFGYPHDLTAAQQTIEQLKFFLAEVANRTSATTIHLIGHSMGNLPLTRALTDLAGRPELRRFKQIILTAPDIDAVVFKEQIAPGLAKLDAHVTLYASSGDSALRASKAFNGARRAGDSTEPLVVDGIDTIDASNVVTDFLGHSPFVQSVLVDMFTLMRQGNPPDLRFGMNPMRLGALRYWVFRPIAR